MSYRNRIDAEDLIGFEVKVKESNLLILSRRDIRKEAKSSLLRCRYQIEEYIKRFPEFGSSLLPVSISEAPEIVKEMSEASCLANVGPMASVAGVISDFVARDLRKFSEELIIENGGDIFLQSKKRRVVSIFAGESPLSNKIGLQIEGKDTPLGIATSSGTVGHSLSLGKADAVVVIAKSAALADAVATSIGNSVKGGDFNPAPAFAWAKEISGVLGAVIIKGDKMGAVGRVKLIPL